ncbi:MAG TPA: hypothetical protein V6C52_00190 [Coleofasciculaceae cyanobacterium]|jgi:hypothetical protein
MRLATYFRLRNGNQWQRRGVWSLVVILILSGTVQLPAHAIKATAKKTVVIQPRIPTDSVSATEAVKQIEAHMKTIAERKLAMSALYDYKPSVATMSEAFKRNGANQWSIDQYAANAGQNGLYLTWDVVARFYDAHYEALRQSQWDIQMKKMATVKKADLAYLDQGMAAWTSKEKEVQVRMQHYTDTKGKVGAAMGEAHENWRVGHDDPYLETRYQAANAQYHHLDDIAGTLNTAVRDIGYKTRLFSAITATERIPVAEQPPEKIKRVPAQ